jgi:hypothetical protein
LWASIFESRGYTAGVSAWSFPRKGDAVESVARPLSVESLDGQRVRGRLTVRFDRPLAIDVAERQTSDLVAAIAAIIGEEICGGVVPFTGDELVAKVTARARTASARVSSFHVGALELADVTSPAAYASRSTVPPSVAPRAAGRSSGSSGVMPAVGASSRAPADAASTAIRTLWARAVPAPSSSITKDRMGRLFAPALRDSTAVAVFAMLAAVDPAALDRLELLEGRARTSLLPQLRREACACLTAAFYRVLVGAAVEQEAAREVSETACREALAPDPLPAAEIQRYLASSAPLRDLAHCAAAALGAPDDTSRLFAALSSYGTTLRADFVTAASSVRRVHGAA